VTVGVAGAGVAGVGPDRISGTSSEVRASRAVQANREVQPNCEVRAR
jgi:hypothetical protein